MLRFIVGLFKQNPLSKWIVWVIRTLKLIYVNRGKNLSVGYMSQLSEVSLGRYVTIYDRVSVASSSLGNYVYVSSGSRLYNTYVGNFCSIGPNVQVGLGRHPTSRLSTHPAFYSVKKQCQKTFVSKTTFEESAKVFIGSDVWIGANVIIRDGVKIGDGAVIGAGAVVTSDIEPYSIVGGIPAKFIKYRFNEIIKKQVIESEWWNKSDDWLIRNLDKFLTQDLNSDSCTWHEE